MCRLTEANISIAKCPGMVHANGGNDEFEWNITKTHVIKPWSNLPQSNPKVTAYYCTSWNIQALLNKALFKTNINIHTESNETPKLDTRWTMKSSQCCHVRHVAAWRPLATTLNYQVEFFQVHPEDTSNWWLLRILIWIWTMHTICSRQRTAASSDELMQWYTDTVIPIRRYDTDTDTDSI